MANRIENGLGTLGTGIAGPAPAETSRSGSLQGGESKITCSCARGKDRLYESGLQELLQAFVSMLKRLISTMTQFSTVSLYSRPGASGANGFLWKPVSDTDQKLAILLPRELTGEVISVTIASPQGQSLDKGRFSGVGNGSREHYRFPRAGSSYPPGSSVVIQFRDGTNRRILIQNPGSRTELNMG